MEFSLLPYTFPFHLYLLSDYWHIGYWRFCVILFVTVWTNSFFYHWLTVELVLQQMIMSPAANFTSSFQIIFLCLTELIGSVNTTFKRNGDGASLVAQGWRIACQCRRHRFSPWSRRVPQAAERPRPCAATTEAHGPGATPGGQPVRLR